MRNRNYTIKDWAEIFKDYPDKSSKEIAEIVDRTEQAVNAARFRYGIPSTAKRRRK